MDVDPPWALGACPKDRPASEDANIAEGSFEDVGVSDADVAVLQAMAARTASDVSTDPKTGADLGSGEAT